MYNYIEYCYSICIYYSNIYQNCIQILIYNNMLHNISEFNELHLIYLFMLYYNFNTLHVYVFTKLYFNTVIFIRIIE